MTETSDRNGNYIFAHELNPNTAKPQTTKNLINRLEEHYRTYDDQLYHLELRSSKERMGESKDWERLRVKEMPDELATFIAQEKSELTKYEQRNGINLEEIRWNKIYYAEPINMDLSSADTIAHTGVLHTQLSNLPIELRWVKLYQEAIIAGHELYHNSAPFKFRTFWSSFGHRQYNFETERSGIQYRHRNEEDSPNGTALEEGLAIKWQLESEKRARVMFPKGAEDYDMALKKASEAGGVEDKDKQLFIITSWNLNNQIEYEVHSRDPVNLVEYLETQISDFGGLVERARVDNKTLDLARHIEARFGRGSYKKIVTTPIEKAGDLIKDLQNINPIVAKRS